MPIEIIVRHAKLLVAKGRCNRQLFLLLFVELVIIHYHCKLLRLRRLVTDFSILTLLTSLVLVIIFVLVIFGSDFRYFNEELVFHVALSVGQVRYCCLNLMIIMFSRIDFICFRVHCARFVHSAQFVHCAQLFQCVQWADIASFFVLITNNYFLTILLDFLSE